MPKDLIDNFKLEEWEFVFESERKSLLFEDFLVSYYMPYGGSVNYYVDGNIIVYERKQSLANMAAIGNKRSLDEIKAKRDAYNHAVEAARAELPQYRANADFDRADAEAMFTRMAAMIESYGYFDSFYWEQVYERKDADPEAQKIVTLLEEFKNVAKMQLVEDFFTKDGYFETLLAQVGNACSVAPEVLHWYTEKEVMELFEGKCVAEDELQKRYRARAFYINPTSKTLYVGDEAQQIIDLFKDTSTEQVVFRGKTAHKGAGTVVRGKVAIIKRDYGEGANMRKQMEAMGQGDILVAETTDPECMPALRKAAAIVTDVGGLLSHAAIVARELNVPCVIATGNASKILKTGDLVEVDTNKGIVTILERA